MVVLDLLGELTLVDAVGAGSFCDFLAGVLLELFYESFYVVVVILIILLIFVPHNIWFQSRRSFPQQIFILKDLIISRINIRISSRSHIILLINIKILLILRYISIPRATILLSLNNLIKHFLSWLYIKYLSLFKVFLRGLYSFQALILWCWSLSRGSRWRVFRLWLVGL